MVAVPVLSPALGSWLVWLLVLLNCLLLLPLLLLLLSPPLSLSLMSSLSQLLLAPLWRSLDCQGHLALEVPPDQGMGVGLGPEGLQVAPVAGEDAAASDRGVADWTRQLVFVVCLALCQHPQVDVLTVLICSLLWSVGVRCLLTLLASALITLLPRDALSPSLPASSPSLIQPASSSTSVPAEDLSSPVNLARAGLGVLCLAHCAQRVTPWELAGLVVFSVCSDRRMQQVVKLQARKVQVDAVEGFEGELLQGAVMLLDLAVCAAFFVLAVRRQDYPALVLSYSNGFLAVMELRVQVWLEVQAGLRRMSELRRATRRELAAHNDVCAVCLGAMTAARITRCRHLFHGKCLRQALRVSPQCPLCKKHVMTHSVYLVDPMAELEG